MLLPAQTAISRFRRDLTFSRLLKGLFVLAVPAAFLLRAAGAAWVDPLMVLPVVACVFLVLSFGSVKGSRLMADSPSLIASGQFEEAEKRIDEALRSFSLFRHVKVLGLHHLALLRHAQHDWQESALLCRALIGQPLGNLRSIGKPARLMLADALLEMGDVRGAGEAIGGLYEQRLSLPELMKLLVVQLDYQSRTGAWADMMNGITNKVQLAELMPAPSAARAQALLSLAARKTGRADWADWLRRRAELLADVQKLTTERPILWELWRA